MKPPPQREILLNQTIQSHHIQLVSRNQFGVDLNCKELMKVAKRLPKNLTPNHSHAWGLIENRILRFCPRVRWIVKERERFLKSGGIVFSDFDTFRFPEFEYLLSPEDYEKLKRINHVP